MYKNADAVQVIVMNMTWVVQNNIGNHKDSDTIKEVCIKHGYSFIPVKVTPFSSDLPEVNTGSPTIFYGATNFINNVYQNGRWIPGTFFHITNFTIRACMEHYMEHMLNYPCEFTTIGKFAQSHQPMDRQFFIRPNKDLKEFSGDVMDFNKMVRWERSIRHLPGCDNNPTLTTDTEIVVAEPVGIAHEWRLFVVKGKVSSGSHYRSYGKLTVTNDLPEHVKCYVEEMCRIWAPAQVFVMDVAESAGNLYIVECNCFNSSGFYDSNIEKIIVDVSNLSCLSLGQVS